MTKPLLTLSMIVKDEAATIEATLRSVAPYIDRYCIVDTGSTDDTVNVITRVMLERNVPGFVQMSPFVDFATTRNYALELCADAAVWTLYLDADDILTQADGLRETLQAYTDRDAGAMRVDVEVPQARFASTRIVRSGSPWRFVGATHEVLVGPGEPVRILGPVIKHFPPVQSQERSRARWERDVVLLRTAVDKDPHDTRSWFYLGLTYSWLGQFSSAHAALSKRVALGGWAEEVYYAKLQLARGYVARYPVTKYALWAYLDAYASRTTRAEPLYELAHHYHVQNDHALCLLFAKLAWETPLPVDDVLFVDREVYTWKAAELVSIHAYYTGAFDLGERAARQVLALYPTDARLHLNLQFYTERKR